jgi:hypothetical protein
MWQITFALLVGAVLAQGYVSFRVIDGWNLSLRRERVLVAMLLAVDSQDIDAAKAASDAINAELAAQQRYERERWPWQRSPRWPNPWPS